MIKLTPKPLLLVRFLLLYSATFLSLWVFFFPSPPFLASILFYTVFLSSFLPVYLFVRRLSDV